MPRPPEREWASLRLKDRITPGLRVLFVGINPGVRSAQTGHHFAGPSNRFWKLLAESGLVPEPITYERDDRLPEFGFGITNLVARPSPGIDVLKPAEYIEGWRVLERKIEKYRPTVVALVGVTVYRALLPLIAAGEERPSRASRPVPVIGLQPHVVHGARVFVLPNPSGRNANYSYAEMLAAFKALAAAIRRLGSDRGQTGVRPGSDGGQTGVRPVRNGAARSRTRKHAETGGRRRRA